MALPGRIPDYSTEMFIAGPGGDKILNPIWWRYFSNLGNAAQNTNAQLIQGTLADRPAPGGFGGIGVIYFATDRSQMYVVVSGAWVQVMSFIANDGAGTIDLTGNLTVSANLQSVNAKATGTLEVDGAADLKGAVTAEANVTVTGDVSAANALVAGSVIAASLYSSGQVLAGSDISAVGDIFTVLGTVRAATLHSTGPVTAIGNITTLLGTVSAAIVASTGPVTAVTTIAAGSTVSGAGFIASGSTGQTNVFPVGPLTLAGTAGSITFTGGIETAHTDPT